MNAASPTLPFRWEVYLRAMMVVFTCALFFVVGVISGTFLPREAASVVTGMNLTFVLGFVATLRLKRLARLTLPFLLGLSILGGMLAQIIAANTYLPIFSLGVGLVVLGWLTLLVRFPFWDFHSLQTPLTLLALVFSLIGALFVYANSFPLLTLIWSAAGSLCLCLILYNALHRLIYELPLSTFLQGAASLFLLMIGLVANVAVFFSALGI